MYNSEPFLHNQYTLGFRRLEQRMCAPVRPYVHSRTQHYHELKIHVVTNSKSIHNRTAEAQAENLCSWPTVCTLTNSNIITNSKSIKSRTQNRFAIGLRRHEQRICAPDRPYIHSQTQYYHELQIHRITNSKSIHNRIAEARASASTGARGTAAKIVGNRLFAFCTCRVFAYWFDLTQIYSIYHHRRARHRRKDCRYQIVCILHV